MKRSEVLAKAKELGIESDSMDDLLNYILEVNGNDINKAKATNANDLQELEALKTYKTETEAKLAGFKDYEELKQFKADTLAKAENQQKIDWLKSDAIGCKHPELMMSQIDWSKASFNAEKKSYEGLDDALKNLKDTYKDMFQAKGPQQPNPYAGQTQGQNSDGFEAYKKAHPELGL